MSFCTAMTAEISNPLVIFQRRKRLAPRLRKAPCFRDSGITQRDIISVPRAVADSEPENAAVYQAWVWIHDDTFEEEDWHILGFFGDKEAAEGAVNAWKMLKPQESLQGLCFEAVCESVFLDQLQWPEGFSEETHRS